MKTWNKIIQPVRLQFVRHGPHATGEDKVWQKGKKAQQNGSRERVETHVRINDDKENLWASENIDMKVFNERTNTVSTTTTLNSKYDAMTSLATSPTPSYNNMENGAKSGINSNNLVSKLCESDKLITWT